LGVIRKLLAAKRLVRYHGGASLPARARSTASALARRPRRTGMTGENNKEIMKELLDQCAAAKILAAWTGIERTEASADNRQ
jgi:hypothetical protein